MTLWSGSFGSRTAPQEEQATDTEWPGARTVSDDPHDGQERVLGDCGTVILPTPRPNAECGIPKAGREGACSAISNAVLRSQLRTPNSALPSPSLELPQAPQIQKPELHGLAQKNARVSVAVVDRRERLGFSLEICDRRVVSRHDAERQFAFPADDPRSPDVRDAERPAVQLDLLVGLERLPLGGAVPSPPSRTRSCTSRTPLPATRSGRRRRRGTTRSTRRPGTEPGSVRRGRNASPVFSLDAQLERRRVRDQLRHLPDVFHVEIAPHERGPAPAANGKKRLRRHEPHRRPAGRAGDFTHYRFASPLRLWDRNFLVLNHA